MENKLKTRLKILYTFTVNKSDQKLMGEKKIEGFYLRRVVIPLGKTRHSEYYLSKNNKHGSDEYKLHMGFVDKNRNIQYQYICFKAMLSPCS